MFQTPCEGQFVNTNGCFLPPPPLFFLTSFLPLLTIPVLGSGFCPAGAGLSAPISQGPLLVSSFLQEQQDHLNNTARTVALRTGLTVAADVIGVDFKPGKWQTCSQYALGMVYCITSRHAEHWERLQSGADSWWANVVLSCFFWSLLLRFPPIPVTDTVMMEEAAPSVAPPAPPASISLEREQQYRKVGLTKEVLSVHTQKEEQAFLTRFKDLSQLHVFNFSSGLSWQESSHAGHHADRGKAGLLTGVEEKGGAIRKYPCDESEGQQHSAKREKASKRC